jgi:hypothetical protein
MVGVIFNINTANMLTNVFASNGQGLAPGQGIDAITGEPIHNNPSEGNPPPGQNDPDLSNIFGNTGQCQQYLRDHFDGHKHLMQEFCHDF